MKIGTHNLIDKRRRKARSDGGVALLRSLGIKKVLAVSDRLWVFLELLFSGTLSVLAFGF